MSIRYSFTEHDTIRIECGNDLIEVRLPHVVTDATPAPAPERDPGQPTTAPPDTPKPPVKLPPTHDRRPRIAFPERPDYPAFIVVGSGNKPEDLGVLFESELKSGMLVDLSAFASGTTQIEALVEAKTTLVGDTRMLDVKVDTPVGGSLAFDNLNNLMKDAFSGLDAVRLWSSDE